jgi:AcrR family transcriptional regulator
VSPRGVPVDPVERAGRILDAAARLLLRYGHNRTTINDIAREAGVAKGSVYAHWRSRELLFLALLRREQAAVRIEVRDRLRAAGRPADLELVLAESVRAHQRNPLVTAVLTRNTEILGDLAKATAEEGSPRGVMVELLVALRSGGWIRTDRTLAEQVTMVASVYLGYFLTESLLPGEFHVPADAVPDLVAETVRRALERPEPLTPDEVAAVDRVVHDHIAAAVTAAEDRLRDAQPSGEETT